MICKFNDGLMDVTDVIEKGDLIFRFDRQYVSVLNTDFSKLLPDTRLQAKHIVNAVRCIKVVNFLSPNNVYINRIIEQYEVKVYGITLYQWIKLIAKGEKRKDNKK